MKRATSCGIILILMLPGCTSRRATNQLPTPKAYGTQIVEVSGGKQIAGVGSKLSDPLVVQVNGADGSPVAGALVSFRCAGLTFTPPDALSDASGQVSAAVQLAGIPGSYQVLAETPKSGGGTVTVTSREIALGYQEKLGKEVSEKYCTVCHDPESTPERVSNFDNLTPPAPHLFTDGNTLNPMSDGDLIKIIADGGPALGKSPQTPAYRNTLTSAEIKAVVAYLRAVADPPYPGGRASSRNFRLEVPNPVKHSTPLAKGFNYNCAHAWRSPLVRSSDPTKLSPRSVPEAWARCIAPAILAWGGMLR